MTLGSVQSEHPENGNQYKGINATRETYVFNKTYTFSLKEQPADKGPCPRHHGQKTFS